jgi:hypothetical protein
MLQFSAKSVPIWPVVGDIPDLQSIVHAQAVTISDQAALIEDFQDTLDAAQAAPPTTATGNSTGTTSLALTNVSGAVLLGATVTGGGLPVAGVTIVSQQSGTAGGNGTYITSAVTTVTNGALTISPSGSAPPLWPAPEDAPTLTLIQQQQTAIMRSQTALLQQYLDLLNTSQTAPTP